jgi:hypothetical protein
VLQVFDFDFFFFFFAMTLSVLSLTLKEQWLQRHECDMNGLWRIGFIDFACCTGRASPFMALNGPHAMSGMPSLSKGQQKRRATR